MKLQSGNRMRPLETQSVPVFSSEWRESAPRGGFEQKARYLPALSSSLFYPAPLQKPEVPRQPEEFFLSINHSMASIEWPSKKQSLSHTRSFSDLTTTLHCIRNPNQSTGKRDKGIKMVMKEVKLSLFTDSVIVKVENY